jgi:6-pyruvoyltetrahydropterin/6-carboxytetrahydropterin synthase
MSARITCTRRLSFCAGHRVVGHENKCRNVHGHNYVIHIEAEADLLDPIGRVIDFAALKERIGGWLEANWDHGFLAWDMDPLVAILHGVPGNTKVCGVPFNPTAENLARHLLDEVCPKLLDGTGVRVVRVVVEETENCSAEATAR